jgi:hypothetical protein
MLSVSQITAHSYDGWVTGKLVGGGRGFCNINKTLHHAYNCVLSKILNLRLSAYTALSVRVFDRALRKMKTEISITQFQASNGSLCHDKGLDYGLSPGRSKFRPGPVHLRFTVGKEALNRFFSTSGFSCKCHYTNVPHQLHLKNYSNQKDKWPKPGNT